MSRQTPRTARQEKTITRCAIYTRKSTEDGLEQEFNSLDAQRLSGENYVRSQEGEGWRVIPDLYDDGGFTGGNMDRPALKRLIADIEAGKIDCVVVYKVDRLSRSLLDFSRILELFEKHHVSFVSVTQLFNTANSMGRLMLNVLLSFAQFEREIISERTRDKIAAARRQGKWVGGMPLLGYDVTSPGSRLTLNESEAAQVRAIFDLYLQERSLIRVIAELDQRGWNSKKWTTRVGTIRGGRPFTKAMLHKLLTNVTYIGKVRHKHDVHDGEHEAIVAPDVWQRTQASLQKNGRTGGRDVRNEFTGLLRGLLRCLACNSAMTPSHSKKKDGRRYRYYICCHAQKRGWQNCPCPSVPAEEMEKFVVDQIRGIGRQPQLIRDIVDSAQQQSRAQSVAIESEQAELRRNLSKWNTALRNATTIPDPAIDTATHSRVLADLQDQIRNAEQQLTRVTQTLAGLRTTPIGIRQAEAAMLEFDAVWNTLATREQRRILELLVDRVDFNGDKGTVAVTFNPDGIGQIDLIVSNAGAQP